MADFQLEARTRSGTYLATLPARNIQGEFRYNSADSLRWELPLYHSVVTRSNLDPGITEAWLWRDGSLIFAGPIWNATATSKENKLTCTAEGLESYLDMRILSTETKITNQAGQIIWQLIAASQAETDGNLFITSGTLTTPSLTLTQRKNELNTLAAILKLLSDQADFDWAISPSRVFSCYYPRLQSPARTALEFGGNISSYSVQVMGKWVSNEIHFKKSSDDNTVYSPAISSTSRAKYGLRELTLTDSDLTSRAQVTNLLNLNLRNRKEARQVPQVIVRANSVIPYVGDIDYGQLVLTVIDDGWTQLNQLMRCTGWQLTIDKHGGETYSFYLNDLREVA